MTWIMPGSIPELPGTQITLFEKKSRQNALFQFLYVKFANLQMQRNLFICRLHMYCQQVCCYGIIPILTLMDGQKHE